MKEHLFANQLNDVLLETDCFESLSNIKSRTKPLLDKRKVILVGAGALGKWVANRLKMEGKTPVAFCDNNSKLWNSQVEGIPVLSPSDAVILYQDSGIFIATVYTSSPLLNQLAALDVCFLSFPELAWCYSELLLPHCALDVPQKLKGEEENIQKCLEIWSDEESKQEYVGQIKWRLMLDRSALLPHAPTAETYFASDLFQLSHDEVMIDVGAYTGDSIQEFLSRIQNSFKKIIAIEADSKNSETLQCSLNKLKSSKIEIVNKVVGSKNEIVKFDALGSVSSTISKQGIELECVTLDDIVGGDIPTYIKMDIEGAELDALQGAQQTISQYHPILAICLYHHVDDLWKIPNYLHSIAPEYKFFLRRYSDECWEQVCYAVPVNRSKK